MEVHHCEPLPKQKYGWSKEEINQALEEGIWIQNLKDNPNMMLGLSPLCCEGIIHDLDIVPIMYYDLPNNDSDQIDLPLSLLTEVLHKVHSSPPER